MNPYHLKITIEPSRCLFQFGKSFLYAVIALLLLVYSPPHMSYATNKCPRVVHVVKRGDTLSEIALKYRVSVEQLKDWSRFRGDKIFEGQHLEIRPSSGFETYVVRSGDTLSEIASQFGMSLSSIRNLNHIYRDKIYPGQKLRLCRPSGITPVPGTHVVRKGDTLWDIARLYGLSVPEIKEINDLRNETIIPGMSLKLSKASKEEEIVEEEFEYVVKRGDNLSTIAQRFNVGLNLLRQLNHLQGDHIYPGQRLQVRPSSLDEAVHIVRPGETLSSISLKYNIEISQLREMNDIEGSEILIGDKLRVKKTPTATHIVERGDALWEIARAYGMSVEDLMRLNGLSSHRIYPGQELQLSGTQSDPLDVYIVKEGDYLGRIARLHQMSVADLKKVNNLRTSVIYPGDELKVNPLLSRGREWSKISEINWDDLMVSSDKTRKIDANNGPYYHMRPIAAYQRHAGYYENPRQTPLQSYREAQELWEVFEREIARLGRVSDALNGWYFVLDPGHGGLDPGAIVEVLDGKGNRVYVVEDEYVYDIALRVYVLLRLHGAEVTMTLLGPNHLIRHSSPPTRTFVNEKNEVYNSYQFNKNNRWRDWPSGGRDGNLLHRVRIAREFFKKTPKNRRIFLSFHADIDPESPEAPLVLYYQSRNGRYVDVASKNFAQALLPALGAGAYARGQSLGVLRNNPAGLKVLLELRNLAYPDHAWALRFEQLRHRDAEKVVKALLDYVQQEIRVAKSDTGR
ncbi:MAG: LysM peptidoglycan-binding domain-containing protein [Pseudomonadota bacterium]